MARPTSRRMSFSLAPPEEAGRPCPLWAARQRWREEAAKYGHAIARIAIAFEAGRDGFWLARWLRARGVEAFVIHSTSVAVPREHRRAKTDRFDTEHLKRAFLGWLRGVSQQTSIINRMKACLIRLGCSQFQADATADEVCSNLGNRFTTVRLQPVLRCARCVLKLIAELANMSRLQKGYRLLSVGLAQLVERSTLPILRTLVEASERRTFEIMNAHVAE